MQLSDISARVRAKCDDPDGTYITDELILGLANDVYDWLFAKMKLTNSSFDDLIVILPAVPAGSPNLDSYQASAQPLETLIRPRMLRWRLPGTDATFFRRADGPLDYVRDIQNGIPAIDSWTWERYSIGLSNFSTALDIEISGEFLFDPLTGPDSAIQISRTANRVLSCKIAAEVGKARGNDKWATTYEADALDALDDLDIALTKENQGKTARVGRISRVAGRVVPTNR